MKKINLEKKTWDALYEFIEQYGNDALLIALRNYDQSHNVYTIKTKLSTKRIPLASINYVEIFGHNIVVHTTNGNFTKYGTLKNEYIQLKKQGFIKCNQSFLIPINKIVEIKGKNVILTTGDKFPLSRSCANDVICAYVKEKIKC